MNRIGKTTTPEMRERIIALGLQGKRPREIANEVGGGIRPNYVSVLLSQARGRGVRIPYCREDKIEPVAPSPARGRTLSIDLDVATFKYLSSAAARRDVTISYVVAEMLTTIAKDDMIDAVLEDGVKA